MMIIVVIIMIIIIATIINNGNNNYNNNNISTINIKIKPRNKMKIEINLINNRIPISVRSIYKTRKCFIYIPDSPSKS